MNSAAEVLERVEDRIHAWGIDVDHITETERSILAFGNRDNQPVVLKVIKNPGDEWRSGEILSAFDGHGAVRVYEYVEGAMLIERLNPGNSLLSIIEKGGGDYEVSEVLVETIKKMSSRLPMDSVPTIENWGKGFERYMASGDNQIPKDLLFAAQRLYGELCQSQKRVRLLHGDLHHSNVLFDAERGWLTIDPKGVIGELEYEVGAALRNPIEKPELFTNVRIIQKRIKHFAIELNLNAKRVLAWAFAQAVLSAIWTIEDGFQSDQDYRIDLARTLWPMLNE